MPIEQRELQLINRARQDDKEAFGDLYEMHLEELYRYIYYRVSPKEDAEDLTEQVFLKAWEGLSAYRGDASFKAWLYRIARNAVVDHYRVRKDDTPLDDKLSLADKKAQPEELMLAQDRATRLIEAISGLSPLHQDVIVLRFINGHSTKEMAEILERNIGVVRVLQHRALKSMRVYLVAEDIVNG
jgi:RNA polymerase sigma-70 factor (ECF subfamily)